MPSPQALVAFVTTLFVLLIATRAGLGWSPVVSAAVSVALAVAFGAVVERRVPDDEEDEVTQEADLEVRPPRS